VDWLADLADALSLDVAWQCSGQKGDGEWRGLDPRDLALTVELRLQRKAVADRLSLPEGQLAGPPETLAA